MATPANPDSIATFTPGPWKFCPSRENDFLGIYPDTGRPEFPIAKMPEIIRPEINLANGRLIAAAPDLVADALPLIAEISEYPPSAGEDADELVEVRLGDLRALRRSVAKAIGGAP